MKTELQQAIARNIATNRRAVSNYNQLKKQQSAIKATSAHKN